MTLSADRLRELLDYDPLTGVFLWRASRGPRRAGAVAGCVLDEGYIQIMVDRRRYRAHRLAWLWMTGEWPVDEVDHRDVNPENNRWDNLRPATRSENESNKHARARSGLKGVRRCLSGRYGSAITVRGRAIHLGTFDAPEEAHAAYVAAAKQHFGQYARAA